MVDGRSVNTFSQFESQTSPPTTFFTRNNNVEISRDWEIELIQEAVNYFECVIQDAKDWKEQKHVEEKVKKLIKREKELCGKTIQYSCKESY